MEYKIDSIGRKYPIKRKPYKSFKKKGKNKRCMCGNLFYVYPYRLKKTNFCSKNCVGLYGNNYGKNKGKKIPKISISKLGFHNPMKIYGISPEHLRKLTEGGKKYRDSIKVTTEHKKLLKKISSYNRKTKIKGKFKPAE